MKLRPFELGLIAFFVTLAIGALILLSNPPSRSGGTDGQPVIGRVVIWGTLPASPIRSLITDISAVDNQYKNVFYQYIPAEDFEGNLVEAIAAGTGPDLILHSHEQLVDIRRWVQPFSYESFPIRDIKNIYLDGASIFALNDGLYGYPVMVNPIVMFWNRDILTNEGYLTPPATWEEIVNSSVRDLIMRDDGRNIQRAVVAMGEYGNVRNSFGILSLLLLQSGTNGVTTQSNGTYQIELNRSASSNSLLNTVSDFYTRFGRPSNELYSWNRSFEEDRSVFISGDLALYFGFASEGPSIERANPNLNFDIAEIPQGASASVRRTYGDFYTLSLLKSSRNQTGAFTVMSNLSSAESAGTLASGYGMVPAYRSLVVAGSNEIYGRVAFQTAPVAYGWLNPNRLATDQIFGTMIEDINSNRRDVPAAVVDALSRLRAQY